MGRRLLTDPLKAQRTPIEGLTVTALSQIGDERGAVLHFLRCDAPDFTLFGECYCSEILPGAIKAWKRHRRQTQNVAVPVGRIRMVVYDDRQESTSKGRLHVLEMGRPDAYFRLRISAGLTYGFACVSDSAALLVNCSDVPHDAEESETFSLDHPLIPYRWTTE